MTGYLALLLAKILTSAPSSHSLILPYLPGAKREDKLEGLLTSLSELDGLQLVMQRKLREMVPSTIPEQEFEGEAMGGEILEQDPEVLQSAINELRTLLAGEI